MTVNATNGTIRRRVYRLRKYGCHTDIPRGRPITGEWLHYERCCRAPNGKELRFINMKWRPFDTKDRIEPNKWDENCKATVLHDNLFMILPLITNQLLNIMVFFRFRKRFYVIFRRLDVRLLRCLCDDHLSCKVLFNVSLRTDRLIFSTWPISTTRFLSLCRYERNLFCTLSSLRYCGGVDWIHFRF